MLIQQLEPLAEQQIVGIYGLRHSSQQAEEALSQGLEQLRHSLIDTIAGAPVVDGVQQMVVAMGKLANLEGFVHQVINYVVISMVDYVKTNSPINYIFTCFYNILIMQKN